MNVTSSVLYGNGATGVCVRSGYDILQQINSITQNYNSQGRTETWVRSIPSYVMATLTYKFHVAPKKK